MSLQLHKYTKNQTLRELRKVCVAVRHSIYLFRVQKEG